jgi:predicted nucleotidyltransferase component of viral defense system
VRLLIDSPFGATEVPARLDLGRRPLWLPAEVLAPLPLPIHARYGFALPAVPTARVEEVIAEKLARFRRASLARDLYDLAWLSSRPFDELLVRRLTVLKVWCDVVDDGLGTRPFDPEDILRIREHGEFQPEAIGYLTTPVDIPAWVALVRTRFAFMRDMDAFDARIARCSRGVEHEAREAIGRFRAGEWPRA